MSRKAILLTLALAVAGCLQAWARSDVEDKVRFGQSITVASGEKIGDAVCFGCSVRIEGETGDVVVFGGSVSVNGRTADVAVFGGSIELGPQADVRGDVAVAGGEVHRDPAARVKGDVQNLPGKAMFGIGGVGMLFLFSLLGAIPLALLLTLLAFLILKEPRVNVMANAAKTQTGAVLLAGLAVVVAMVLLCGLAIRVGHSLRVLMFIVCLGFVVTLVVGYTGLSSWIGRQLAKNAQPLAVVLVGAVAICILQAIPLIGGIAFVVFVLLALGSAVFTGYGSAQDWFRTRVG
ncbi:MAG TPA: hypothetical protein VEG30_13570 [Terriglobales bacterium]|nr:hypothetical protein [Terriglobales bacterium]